MIVQLGEGTHPLRMDLGPLRAGEPFDYLIPVSDSAGVALDQTAWEVTHSVLTVDRSQALGALTVTQDALGLILSATPEQTTAWAATWPTYCPWFLRSVHPSGEPLISIAGWVSIYR